MVDNTREVSRNKRADDVDVTNTVISPINQLSQNLTPG